MYVIDVSGSGRARGRAHGEALRDQVNEHLARWRESLVGETGVDPIAYRDEFLADTNFLPTAQKHVPDLVEEALGIAEGAGSDWLDTFVRLLSDEEPWYRRARLAGTWPGRSRIGKANDEPLQSKGCSSIGIGTRLPHRTRIIAQNMDTPRWWDGHQVLLRTTDPVTGVRALVFTVAGKISLCGMNDRGLAITCNTLSQLDYDPSGLAEDFVVRGYLAQPDIEAGLQFMRRVPHASGQNYTIPGPDGSVINLECSARHVVAWRPDGCHDRVFHANHPLLNRDTALYERDLAHASEELRASICNSTTLARFDTLARQIGNPDRDVDAEDIRAALSTSPVCRAGTEFGTAGPYTLASLLMWLGEEPSLEIAAGPPDRMPYRRFRFG